MTLSDHMWWQIQEGLDFLGCEIHEIAKDKGWWKSPRNEGELIALIHSELSEALEALRAGNPPSEKAAGYSQVEEELADVVIRVLDMAEGLGLDLSGAIYAKLEHNADRPYKHGKRF